MSTQRFLVELTSSNGDRLDEDDVAEALARMVYSRAAEITVDAQEIPNGTRIQLMPGYEDTNASVRTVRTSNELLG
jgi:hypothetical protein